MCFLLRFVFMAILAQTKCDTRHLNQIKTLDKHVFELGALIALYF